MCRVGGPVIAIVATFAALNVAFASPALRLSVQPVDARGRLLTGPGYFVVTIRPGHTAQLRARFTNHGGKPANIALLPVDSKRSGGNISYNLPGEPRRKVAAWVHLTTHRLRLLPGRSHLVSFLLRVPHTAYAGTYIGALTAFVPLASQHSKREALIQIQTRLAVAIVVHVLGVTS